MSFYEELEAFMGSMRVTQTGTGETKDLYERVTGRVGETPLLGPYGIRSDEWEALAGQSGLQGARWQDKQAQTAVVEQQLTRLYNQFEGRWDLVAVAWQAGEGVADRIANGETIEQVVGGEGDVDTLQSYVNDVMGTAQITPSTELPSRERQGPFEQAALSSAPFANAPLVQSGNNKVRSKTTPDRVISDVLMTMIEKQLARGEVDDGATTGEQRVGGIDTPATA